MTEIAGEKMQLAAAALGGVQYKGQALWQQKQSTSARLKDIARIFGMSDSGSKKTATSLRNAAGTSVES